VNCPEAAATRLVANRLACTTPFYSLPAGLGKRGFRLRFLQSAIVRQFGNADTTAIEWRRKFELIAR